MLNKKTIQRNKRSRSRSRNRKGGDLFDFFKSKHNASDPTCSINGLVNLKTVNEMNDNYQKCCPKSWFGKNNSPYCKQLDLNYKSAFQSKLTVADMHRQEINQPFTRDSNGGIMVDEPINCEQPNLYDSESEMSEYIEDCKCDNKKLWDFSGKKKCNIVKKKINKIEQDQIDEENRQINEENRQINEQQKRTELNKNRSEWMNKNEELIRGQKERENKEYEQQRRVEENNRKYDQQTRRINEESKKQYQPQTQEKKWDKYTANNPYDINSDYNYNNFEKQKNNDPFINDDSRYHHYDGGKRKRMTKKYLRKRSIKKQKRRKSRKH